MFKVTPKPQSLVDWARQQQRILLAVILQDMKTRFGGSYASYLVAIAWPLTHLAVITTGYLIVNHYAPVGDDPFIFVSTAAVPYMLCLYPARLVAMGVLINRPFLNYNLVTPQHLILARIFLEFMNVTIMLILILIICLFINRDLTPLSIPDAAGALGASVFLGISLGFFFAVLTGIFGPFFNMFIVILMIALYIASMAFMPEYMINSFYLEYLAYNPIFCLIKWLRSAYYPSYQLEGSYSVYVLSLAFGFLFLGILGERFLRGRIIGL